MIFFSPDSSGNSSSLTIKGITDDDLSSITISALEGEADADTSGTTSGTGIDLSSGTVEASSASENFVYSVSFVDGSPVALDGNIVIKGFDVDNDTLTLASESVPAGFTKNSLLTYLRYMSPFSLLKSNLSLS